LPWKISVKVERPQRSDAPLGAPLTVIFARREHVRRGKERPFITLLSRQIRVQERRELLRGWSGL
jgi:hypothetical protein